MSSGVLVFHGIRDVVALDLAQRYGIDPGPTPVIAPSAADRAAHAEAP